MSIVLLTIIKLLIKSLHVQVEKRSKDLDQALAKAITFQEEMNRLVVWMQVQEDTIKEMDPIGDELNNIQSQWNDIKVILTTQIRDVPKLGQIGLKWDKYGTF